MPDEVGSGGEQIVATPAIENSLDAVQQAAFDECMRNRVNQIPGEELIDAEAECLRFASQVDLVTPTVRGDTKDGIEEERASHLDDCLKRGFSEEECAGRWEEFLRRWPIASGDAKDQDLAMAARNYPNTSEGYRSFLEDGCGHQDVEDCVQAWEQTYGSRFDTRFDTPTVGVKKDGKWEAHKDRSYTKKPK